MNISVIKVYRGSTTKKGKSNTGHMIFSRNWDVQPKKNVPISTILLPKSSCFFLNKSILLLQFVTIGRNKWYYSPREQFVSQSLSSDISCLVVWYRRRRRSHKHIPVGISRVARRRISPESWHPCRFANLPTNTRGKSISMIIIYYIRIFIIFYELKNSSIN